MKVLSIGMRSSLILPTKSAPGFWNPRHVRAKLKLRAYTKAIHIIIETGNFLLNQGTTLFCSSTSFFLLLNPKSAFFFSCFYFSIFLLCVCLASFAFNNNSFGGINVSISLWKNCNPLIMFFRWLKSSDIHELFSVITNLEDDDKSHLFPQHRFEQDGSIFTIILLW